MITFARLAAVAAFATALIQSPLAMASDEIDAALKDKVTAKMTAEGYEVRKIEKEDGLIEVYAVKGGKTYELYLDGALNVVKTSGKS